LWIISNALADQYKYKGNWSCGWPGYNATGRPWYLLSDPKVDPTLRQNQTRRAWSDLYAYSGDIPVLGYTIVQGVWFNNEFLGVTAVDVTAPYLSRFLADQKTTANTILYVMDSAGIMVATSKKELPLARPDPKDSSNLLPINAADWWESRVRELYSKRGPAETGGVISLNLDDEEHFAVIAQVDATGQERMTWRVVIAVPSNDFMGAVNEGKRQMLYSMIGVCIGVLLICFTISYFIYLPIKLLQDDMASVL
jgi:C4-dicarboxylate-specific signal transduction histidine kinase